MIPSTLHLDPEFELTRVGLVVHGMPGIDAWQRCGLTLLHLESASAWALADWWIAGDHRYGERAAKVAEACLRGRALSFKTLMNRGSVARAFETSRRRDVLSFGHHEVVAALDPAVQDSWLDRAVNKRWTRARLRAEVDRRKPSDASTRRALRLLRLIEREVADWPVDERSKATAILRMAADQNERRYPVLTDDERRELRRIAAELDAFPYVKRTLITTTGRGGDFEIVPGCGGAPVYHDIVGNAGTATRSDVLAAVRRLLEGSCTEIGACALDVARRRLRGDRSLSRPRLPPEAGDEPAPIGKYLMTTTIR